MKNNLFFCLGTLLITFFSIPVFGANPEQDFISNTRLLTPIGARSGEGYFSTDGTKVVFQTEVASENPFYQIYTFDRITGASAPLSSGVGRTTCAWYHPKGDRVLFSSTHLDPDAKSKQNDEINRRKSGLPKPYSWDYDPTYEIFEVAQDGTVLYQLTHSEGYDAEGSYSPDGSLIVFASNRKAYQGGLTPEESAILKRDPSYFMDLYTMKSDGSDVRQLTNMAGYDGGPFFSADGKRIVWRHFSVDGRTAEIFTMDVDGSNKRQITNLGEMSWAPFYHPSGDYIIFAKMGANHDFDLFMVDSQGKHAPVAVSTRMGFDGLPVFSPTGDEMLWTSTRGSDGAARLYLSKWNDKKAREELGLSPQFPEFKNSDSQLSSKDLQAFIERLASPEFEGRMTATQGEILAGNYLQSFFSDLNLIPAGNPLASAGFRDPFGFISGVTVGSGTKMRVQVGAQNQAVDLRSNLDFRPLAMSKEGIFSFNDLVFAGYGIVAPSLSPGSLPYDSYAGLDVKDKWVIAFRYLPEGVSDARRTELYPYSTLSQKIMVARDQGAKGILFVSGPNSFVKEQLISMSSTHGESSIFALSVSDAVAENLVARAGTNLKTLQDALDHGQIEPGFSFRIENAEGSVSLNRQKKIGANVIARLPGMDPTLAPIVIGAHMDHLGYGETGSSRALPGDVGQIHPGADDNASGVAGLMEIAQYLTAKSLQGQRLKRDVVFAAWSGEELGLLGSTNFLKERPNAKYAAYINMDMIGRMRGLLSLQGLGSSSVWAREIQKANALRGLNINLQDDPYVPTDAMSFYIAGVPVLSAFTGSHDEYHSPRDVASLIEYLSEQKIIELLSDVTESLANNSIDPDYKQVSRSPQAPGRTFRIYLGTIPDYTQASGLGVLLSGVKPGSPAEKAGILGGDTLIKLAGRQIDNMQDFVYALQALRPMVQVEVQVIRNGKTVSLQIVPEAKE